MVKSDLQSRLPADVKELAQLETQVENVAERVLPAVVGVQVGGANGSAVIISKDGLVLSAAHVCGEPGRPVTFLFANGKRASGITLGVNKSVDGGMMKITTPGEWPYAPMGDSDKLALGDWVIALGHPNGYSSRRPPVVRLGRLLGRDSMPATLRTDCVLVGGDSGGPMFDLNGLVIGIHSRIGDGATNNLHVPVETFWKEWDRLTVGESWGIAFWQRPNNNNNNRSNDPPAPILGVAWDASPKGLKVARLSSNRPAEKAGIQVGDILKKFDGKAVSTEAQFTEALRKCKANQEVTLEFERQDKPLSIKVKLDPFPTSPGQKKQEKK